MRTQLDNDDIPKNVNSADESLQFCSSSYSRMLAVGIHLSQSHPA